MQIDLDEGRDEVRQLKAEPKINRHSEAWMIDHQSEAPMIDHQSEAPMTDHQSEAPMTDHQSEAPMTYHQSEAPKIKFRFDPQTKSTKQIRQNQRKEAKKNWRKQYDHNRYLRKKEEKTLKKTVKEADAAPRRLAQSICARGHNEQRGPAIKAEDVARKQIPFMVGKSEENMKTDIIMHNAYVSACTQLKVQHVDKLIHEAVILASNNIYVHEKTIRDAIARVQQRYEKFDSAYGKIHSKRGPRGWLFELDEKVFKSIRMCIHQEFWRNGVPLTITDLHRRITNDPTFEFSYGKNVLHQVLRSMGFRWRKGADNNKHYYKSSNMIKLRAHYLRRITHYRNQGRQLIYIDESWVDSTDYTGMQWHDLKTSVAELLLPNKQYVAGVQIPKSSFKRLILIAAHSDDGLIPDSQVCWAIDDALPTADPHRNMCSDKFEYYLRKLLRLPGVKRGCVVIMDNARYHRTYSVAMPKDQKKDTTRQFIQEQMGTDAWLKANPNASSRELLIKARAVRKTKGMNTEKICQAREAQLLFLPPYHPCLNPIEMAWSLLKNIIYKTRGNVVRNTEKMKEFVRGCMLKLFDADNKQKLINCFRHVVKVEHNFMNNDHVQPEPVAPLIVLLEDEHIDLTEDESDDEWDGPVDGEEDSLD